MHNYWCDLLGTEGLNGEPNPAYLIGIAATLILALSIYFIAYILPVFFYDTFQTLPNPPFPTAKILWKDDKEIGLLSSKLLLYFNKFLDWSISVLYLVIAIL